MARPRRIKGLGSRGSALFLSLQARFKDDPARMDLLLETCRVADRLDALNAAVQTRGVVELMRFRRMLGSGDGYDDPIQVEVHFDSVLAEARQQANTFRLMLGQLVPAQAAAAPPVEPPQRQEGPSVDDLARIRRERAGGIAPAP